MTLKVSPLVFMSKSGRREPDWLPFDLAKVQQQRHGAFQEKSNLETNWEETKKAMLANVPNGKKKEVGQKLVLQKDNRIAEISVLLPKMDEFLATCANLEEGGKLPFKIYFELDGHEVIVAQALAAAGEEAAPAAE